MSSATTGAVVKCSVMIRRRVSKSEGGTWASGDTFKTYWTHEVEAPSMQAARTKARRWVRREVDLAAHVQVKFFQVTETFAFLDLEGWQA